MGFDGLGSNYVTSANLFKFLQFQFPWLQKKNNKSIYT